MASTAVPGGKEGTSVRGHLGLQRSERRPERKHGLVVAVGNVAGGGRGREWRRWLKWRLGQAREDGRYAVPLRAHRHGRHLVEQARLAVRDGGPGIAAGT